MHKWQGAGSQEQRVIFPTPYALCSMTFAPCLSAFISLLTVLCPSQSLFYKPKISLCGFLGM